MKIPTVEEYSKGRGLRGESASKELHEIMERYANAKARYYVQAALEAAINSHNGITGHPAASDIMYSILNSYPLTNIK